MPIRIIPADERDNSPNSLGNRIREIRLRTKPTKMELRARSYKSRRTGPKHASNDDGITQAELARRAECSIPVIGHIETNQIKPSPDLVRRIAKALGVTVEEFQTRCPHCDQPLITLLDPPTGE